MPFRTIGAVAKDVVTKARARKAMLDLHTQASIMHEALAEAIQLEDEIERLDEELRSTAHLGTCNEINVDLKRSQRNYQQQIGVAAMATNKVEALCRELGLPHPLAAIVKDKK